MKRAAITLAAVVLLAGCKVGQQPEAVAPAGNGYRVERLFTHDGCTVYKFLDNGNPRYFTRCDGVAAQPSTTWSESCGKGCTRLVEVSGSRP